MSLLEMLLIAIGLSMDAFAVSITRGITMKKLNVKTAVKVAVFFGFFQGFMPFIGWLVGGRFSKYVVKFDHWIAFILLGIIGGKMLFEAFKREEECEVAVTENSDGSIGLRVLLVLAIATSIDALAVGIGFAFLKVDILSVVLLIGIVTLTISFVGVVMGRKLGCLFQKKAEIFGGIVLVLIGLKILLEHTGVTGMILAIFK